jgi:hypothetical protein
MSDDRKGKRWLPRLPQFPRLYKAPPWVDMLVSANEAISKLPPPPRLDIHDVQGPVTQDSFPTPIQDRDPSEDAPEYSSGDEPEPAFEGKFEDSSEARTFEYAESIRHDQIRLLTMLPTNGQRNSCSVRCTLATYMRNEIPSYWVISYTLVLLIPPAATGRTYLSPRIVMLY